MGLLDLLIWSLPGPLPDPGTLVSTWTSLGPGESGPHLDLTRPGDFVTHVDLIAVDSFSASPGNGESDLFFASPRPGDCFSPGHHRDSVPLHGAKDGLS